MSALSVNPTFPIFTDIDGQPLENGYVYVGAANLDPQGNPINVYWDAALTQLAVQPIRTRGGYPVNSGTPARLYVNSDYSIRVMNKNGSTIYSAPAATERINAALISNIDASQITYTPSGTGAVATTVQSKLRESVSVLDFGADPTGATDSTTKISNALATGKRVYFPAGSYKINGLVIPAGAYLYGDGFQKTFFIVNSGGSGAYGFQLNGNYITLADINISGAAENLGATTSAAYYTTFYNVWFGECFAAFRVSHDMFWSRFINVVFRECDKGIYTAASQVLNAVQFISCSTFNAAPGGNYAIDVNGSDGISFIGCDIQNQGIKLASCQEAVFSGGYYECYTLTSPAIKLEASKVRIDGIHAPEGTYFDIDSASAAVLSGKAPPVFAGLFTGVSNQMYGGMADVAETVQNLFPAPLGGTKLAIDALSSFPSGVNGTVSTVSGKTRISVTSNQVNGFGVSGDGIGVYVRWRVVSGQAALRLFYVTTGQQDEINSASSTDWHESYLFSDATAGNPWVGFFSNDGNPAVIEIDKLYVANRKVYFNDSAATAIKYSESSFEGKAVAVTGGGAPATTIFSFDTFGNAGPGVYLATVFRTDRNLSSAVEWATAWLTVHSNSAITLTPIANNGITLSVSGLNLQASTAGANVALTPTFTRMTQFTV